METTSRRMGAIELYMHKMQSQVVWCILNVTPGLTMDMLEKAVAVSVKRQAMLRAHVEGRNLVSLSFDEFVRRNPVLVNAAPDCTDPRALLSEELERGMLRDARRITKLWSVWLAKDAIVVMMNHTISDGGSIVLWLQEMLSSPRNTAVPMCDPLELTVTKWPERVMRRWFPQWVYTRASIALKMPYVPTSASSSKKTAIVTRLLSEEQTTILLANVKLNNTTVAAAVGVAAARAVSKNRRVELQVNISLRGHAVSRGHEEYRECVGYSSAAMFRTVAPFTKTWDEARTLRKAIGAGIRSGEWMESLKEAGSHDPRFIRWLHQKKRMGGISLSSMGNLEIEVDGPVKPVSCFAGIDLYPVGPYALVVCLTLNRRLALSISVADNQQKGHQMLDSIVASLM